MNDVANLLTVDCEEWFVAEALHEQLPKEKWDTLQSTVERNCHRLLDMMHRHGVKSTWFMLGWVAERHRSLMQEIVADGHEIHPLRH